MATLSSSFSTGKGGGGEGRRRSLVRRLRIARGLTTGLSSIAFDVDVSGLTSVIVGSETGREGVERGRDGAEGFDLKLGITSRRDRRTSRSTTCSNPTCRLSIPSRAVIRFKGKLAKVEREIQTAKTHTERRRGSILAREIVRALPPTC